MTKMSRRRHGDADAPATIVDVARVAGVSLGTVSKVLNGVKGVKAENYGRVQAAVQKLKYKPNSVARSMRTRSSKMIGCMVTTLDNPIAGKMVQGAEGVLREAGYALLLSAHHNSLAHERDILEVFKARQAEGVILTVCNDEALETQERLKELNIPVVLWERNAGEAFDTSLTDHFHAAELAAQHLLELGHRRIGLVAAYKDTWTGRQQLEGFERALAAVDAPSDPRLIIHTDLFDGGAIDAMFRSEASPTALIVNVHDVADALRATRRLGLSAPADFSLVSIGDSRELEVFDPPITAIRGDGQAVGVAAAKLILMRLETPSISTDVRRVLTPVELITRSSTGRPPVAQSPRSAATGQGFR